MKEIVRHEGNQIGNNLADIVQLGNIFAQSGFFKDSREAAQCVTKILAGRELGIAPIAAMTGIFIVKEKVTLSANLIAAVIKRSGKYNYRVCAMDDRACAIEFFEHGETIGLSEFSIKDAAAAGLSGGNWKSYPRNMLFARAMSNGAKWFCPDIFAGPIYTPDELGAEVDGETGEPIDVTPPPRIEVLQVQPAPRTIDRDKAIGSIRALWVEERQLADSHPEQDAETVFDLEDMTDDALKSLYRNVRDRVVALRPIELAA